MDELAKLFNIDTNGVKYEDMSVDEKETFRQMLDTVQKRSLTLDDFKEYIHMLRDSVENEIVKYDNAPEKDLLLKGRLKNYMTLESFLTAPDKAKKQLEKALRNVAK